MANESTPVKGRDGCVFVHLLACLLVCCLLSVTRMNIYVCLCVSNQGPVSAACKISCCDPLCGLSSHPCHLHQAVLVDVTRHTGPIAAQGSVKPLTDQDLDDSERLSTCSNSHAFGDKIFGCGLFQADRNSLLYAFIMKMIFPRPPSHWTPLDASGRLLLLRAAPQESVQFLLGLHTALPNVSECDLALENLLD